MYTLAGSALLSSIADTLGQGLLEVTLELHVWHLPVVASGLFTTSGQLTLPKLKVLRLAFPDDGPPRAAEVGGLDEPTSSCTASLHFTMSAFQGLCVSLSSNAAHTGVQDILHEAEGAPTED
jgi:hypothetical protein